MIEDWQIEGDNVRPPTPIVAILLARRSAANRQLRGQSRLVLVRAHISPVCRILDADEIVGDVIPKIESVVSSVTITGYGEVMAVRTKQRVDLVMRKTLAQDAVI